MGQEITVHGIDEIEGVLHAAPVEGYFELVDEFLKVHPGQRRRYRGGRRGIRMRNQVEQEVEPGDAGSEHRADLGHGKGNRLCKAHRLLDGVNGILLHAGAPMGKAE